MALQVWLPLTTDLHNQGLLNDVTVSNEYCTYESEGKIGGCYHAGVNQYLMLNKRTSDLFSDNHSFTIAIWAKFISEPVASSGILASMKWQSEATAGGFGLVTHVANKIQLMIAGTDFSETDPVGSFITPEIGKWIHIAATYDNSTSTYSLYLNGSLIKSNIYTAHTYIANNQEFELGGCPQGGWNAKNDVCLNDARLYNHCLSPKEVKEISKGLVLHYPLNSLVNPNLVENSYFCTNMNNGTVEVVPNVGYVDNTAYYGSPAYHVFREGQTTIAYSEFQFIFRANKCVPGKQYCISFWVKKCHSGGNWGNIILDGLRWFKTGDNKMYTTSITWNNRPSESLLNVWQYASFYFTFPAECTAYAYYYNTVGKDIDYYISKIKVEEGTVSTPWCDYGITNNTVYDCSGYQNNGNIVGSLSCSEDSPRYKTCTNIGTNITSPYGGEYIVGNFNLLTNCNTCTLSFWCNPTQYHSLFSLGNTDSGQDYDKTYVLNHFDNRIFLYYSSVGVLFKPITNEWHLYTIVFNNGTLTIYKDGLVISSATTSRTYLDPIQYLLINHNSAGGVNRGACAKYSDVRLYTTALSADDIKELYNTSAYVANNGTLLTYNLEE